MDWKHPTGKIPESVCLVSLGPSKSDFIADQSLHHPLHPGDEVWTLNTGIRWCRHDVAFIMDDMDSFATHFPEYGKALKNHDRPIITSVAYDEFPTAIAYPLGEVVTAFRQTYFNNSVPYIIAYALMIGVKKMTIFGADYTFPGGDHREAGRACVEFWMGFAACKGMDIAVCTNSTLFDARDGIRFYGYIRQPIIQFGEKKVPMPADNIALYRPPGHTSAA